MTMKIIIFNKLEVFSSNSDISEFGLQLSDSSNIEPNQSFNHDSKKFYKHEDNVMHLDDNIQSKVLSSYSKLGSLLKKSIHKDEDNHVIEHLLSNTQSTEKKLNCDNNKFNNHNKDTRNTALFNNINNNNNPSHHKSQTIYKNVGNNQNKEDPDYQSEVELITLVENSGNIPKYKLRIDKVTEFTGYHNNDWLIETPLIDFEAPIDLNPVLLRETFKLLLQSGERLTQMTKVYNDVEALTKLLEEKERDVELAARIGQSLLDQNQHQTERIDELEQELIRAKDKLRHEISSKSDLLRFYITKDEEDHERNDVDDELNSASISSQISFSKDTSQILEDLERRVISLEEENNRLKIEKENKVTDLENEERKELQLINECARRLNQTNRQIAFLQEEITKKTDENQRLSKEVQYLKQQVNNLEKEIRKLNLEKEDLVSALNLAHECQSNLTIELIDVKEKHTNLLNAFHEKQEECRQLQQQQFNDPIFSYVDSLAYELENSFQFDNTSNDDNGLNHHHHHHQSNHNGNCFTPDSLLSSDSFYTSSPYSSIVVTSSLPTTTVEEPVKSSPPTRNNPSLTDNNLNNNSSSLMIPKVCNTTTTLAKVHHRQYFQTDKLRYIKPIEGSQILNHWRRLANPNLNDLFEDRDRYVSRIKANLVAAEINSKCNAVKDSKELDQKILPTQSTSNSYLNNFVTTNSVFTFTTTSLSHTKETITEVTTTFSDVQPSTGKNEFSVDKHLISSPTSNMITQASLAQLHNRISLVEQVKNILKVDQLSSSSATFQKFKENGRSKWTRQDSINNIVTENNNNDRMNGLNELAKLFLFDQKNEHKKKTASNLLTNNIIGNNRMITKIQMLNSGRLNGSVRKTDNDSSDKTFRTNLSVLRNLRKGGLI